MLIPDLIELEPPDCALARNIINVSQLELHQMYCLKCQKWLQEMQQKHGELFYAANKRLIIA